MISTLALVRRKRLLSMCVHSMLLALKSMIHMGVFQLS